MQGVDGFCLAIQPTEGGMGTIGRKFAYFSRKIYSLFLILERRIF
jgi:hypothetical protein